MRCADCEWYKEMPNEWTDQCLHEEAQYQIGGIREEPTVGHLCCESMLIERCKDHKLFKRKIIPAIGGFHDDKPEERADRPTSTMPGDLDGRGRTLKEGT